MSQKYSKERPFAPADCQGFTIIEVLIALVISAIVITAIYKVYAGQQRAYTAQNQVTEMQQNLRAAFDIMTRELRMAGFSGVGETSDTTCSLWDPAAGFGVATAPGLQAASATQLDFSMDLNEDGDCADQGENLTYDLFPSDNILKLGRRDNTPANPAREAVAENFDAIEFVYLDDTDTATAVLANIRSVQISLLARAGRTDPDHFNTFTYTPASGVDWDLNGAAAGNAPNDNFRRRLLITTVNCRNMGLL